MELLSLPQATALLLSKTKLAWDCLAIMLVSVNGKWLSSKSTVAAIFIVCCHMLVAEWKFVVLQINY